VIGRFNMMLNPKTALLVIGLASFVGAVTNQGNSSLTVAGKPRESLGECMGVHGGGPSETQFDWKGIGGIITGILDAVTPEIPFPIFSTVWNIFNTIFGSISGNEAESGEYFDDLEECIGKMINSAIEHDHVETARGQYIIVLKNLDNFYKMMPKEGTALEEVNLQSLIDFMSFITANTDFLLGHVATELPGYHHERFVQQALEAISMEILAWITFMQRMQLDLSLNSLACDKSRFALKTIEDRLIRFSDPSSNKFSIQYILDHSEFNTWEKAIGVTQDINCRREVFTCEGDATYKVRDDYNDLNYYSCSTNDCDSENGSCRPQLPGGDCDFSKGEMDGYLSPYLKNATDKLRFRDTLRSSISKTGQFVNIAYQEAERLQNYICYGYTDIKCGQNPACGVNYQCIGGECRMIPGCENCIPIVNNWQEKALSEESVEAQSEFCKSIMDGEDEYDPEVCGWLLPMFAETVYPVFLDGQQVCQNQGFCSERTLTSCDYCFVLLKDIGDTIASDYKIEEITKFVMDKWQEDYEDIDDYNIPYYIEKTLKGLGITISEAASSNAFHLAEMFCCEITPNGDCC